MSDDFDLQVLRRGETYLIVARAYGVLVRNKDLNEGVREAVARIEEIDRLYREAGLEPPHYKDWDPRSSRSSRRGSASPDSPSRRGPRLMDYLLPVLLSGAVLSVLLLLAAVPLFSAVARINRSLDGITSMATGANMELVGHKAINVLIRAGDAMDKITPQRKEELRQAVRKIMNGLAPIIEEVGDSVEHDAPTPPPAR